MPHPTRLTRPVSASMTHSGHSKLRKFADQAEMTEGEALSFLFENLHRLVSEQNLASRLRQHRAHHAPALKRA